MANAAHDRSWVKRVQAELDQMCGSNAERLPEFEDWDGCPLLQVTIKESLRIYPNIQQLGFPHASTYFLKRLLMIVKMMNTTGIFSRKGTIFVSNNYHICSSEEEYHNPGKFIPERFLDVNVKDILQEQIGFGSGRRVCISWNVAQRNMFITFSRLLYCFDFMENPVLPLAILLCRKIPSTFHVFRSLEVM